MSILRRYDSANRPVFITCVTFNRQPTLLHLIHPILKSYRHIRHYGVTAAAWVILPDHFHALIHLHDNRLSEAVHRFKRKLSSICYQHNNRGRIWQHRFWDHIIRDQDDLNKHIDYIHFNPVKHGLASEPIDWKWSSIHRWMDEGLYQPDWGQIESEHGREYGE